jgi:hypothetical protein
MENKILEYLEIILFSKQNILQLNLNFELESKQQLLNEIDLLEEIIFEIKNNI